MFDSHCHLTDERFADDLTETLRRARDAGIHGIVTIASDAVDARNACALAAAHPDIYASAGIHPHAAAGAQPGDLETVAELVRSGAAVAIGETGLDYHYDFSPRDRQRQLLDWHLELAAELARPVIIHARDADHDIAAAIRSCAGRVTGVLHCFSSGDDLFHAGLDAGWFVSFAGMITFRNYAGADFVRNTPADHLLLETDGPYLAPIPYRGRRNEPAFLIQTLRAAAAFRDVPPDLLASLVTANARRFYGLPPAI